MYVLDRSGRPVMTSQRTTGGSFYESVRDSRFADGSDPAYRKIETRTEEPSGEGEEKVITVSADYYAGDLTNSRGFFSLLNERFMGRRPTVISTNLSLGEMQTRYSDRVFSRITSGYELYKLTGSDIRLQKTRQRSTSGSTAASHNWKFPSS